MANRKETHEVTLVCDRGHEFTGTVTYAFIGLGEESGAERRVLDRIHDRCPVCGSPNVRPRDA